MTNQIVYQKEHWLVKSKGWFDNLSVATKVIKEKLNVICHKEKNSNIVIENKLNLNLQNKQRLKFLESLIEATNFPSILSLADQQLSLQLKSQCNQLGFVMP